MGDEDEVGAQIRRDRDHVALASPTPLTNVLVRPHLAEGKNLTGGWTSTALDPS